MRIRYEFIYSGCLSQHIEGLVSEKRAAGFSYNSASHILKKIDSFCVENRFACSTVTKELSDAWSIQRDTEGLNARNIRVGVLRQLSKYIISLGMDAFIPRRGQSAETTEAHVFTEDERIAFFENLESLPPVRRNYGNRIKEECWVLFRLYYCCGLRMSEPLETEWDCYDPGSGTLRIIGSKGDKDRIVWLADDIVSMLNNYRTFIYSECPDSAWVFPGVKPGKHLNSATVRSYFIRVWDGTKYADDSNPPTVKSFRHTFVVDRLNLWMSEGVDAEAKLPYLSKFLGHSRIDESMYYYHQVDESRKINRSKDMTSKKVIPEAKNNEEK